MQVEVSDPSPWSTFPPELKSKVVGFAWLMLVEDLGQNSHPTPPNSTSSARAAYWLLRTFALVSKSWHAATLPFAVRHAFTSQKSLPALLEVVQKYGLENAVRAVRIQPDAPSYPTTRSLAEAYAPWVPLLCACPLIQEISFDSFTTSRPDNHLGGGFAVPAFGQWPMLPFVRRLRINHSSDHHLSLSDLEELSRLTPNLVDLALDPDLFTGAADAAAFELYWPNLQSLAFELAINYNQHGRNPLYLRLIKSIAPTLVVFRLHTPPTRPDNPPFAIPDFLTGGTFFPLVTTFSHPYPLALPRELPQPLFPALTHLTVAFFESAPTPAILTLFTTNLVELAIAIPTLEGWLPILCSTCTTARSLRLLELETLDSFARQGNPPFPLFALRNLAQLCAKEQVVFATSDTRVWAKSKGRLGWEEQSDAPAYIPGRRTARQVPPPLARGEPGARMVDAIALGTLIVIVMRARNLPNKVKIGKQNPYALLRYGIHKKKTTTIERGGQVPEWDEEFRFEILAEDGDDPDSLVPEVIATKAGGVLPVPEGVKNGATLPAGSPRRSNTGERKSLKLSCWADDSKDPTLIGETVIDLGPILKKGASDTWWPLEKKGREAGEIYLEMTFYSNKPPPPKPAQSNLRRPVSSSGLSYGGAGSRVEGSDSEEDDRGRPNVLEANYPDSDINPLTRTMSNLSVRSSLPPTPSRAPGYQQQQQRPQYASVNGQGQQGWQGQQGQQGQGQQQQGQGQEPMDEFAKYNPHLPGKASIWAIVDGVETPIYAPRIDLESGTAEAFIESRDGATLQSTRGACRDQELPFIFKENKSFHKSTVRPADSASITVRIGLRCETPTAGNFQRGCDPDDVPSNSTSPHTIGFGDAVPWHGTLASITTVDIADTICRPFALTLRYLPRSGDTQSVPDQIDYALPVVENLQTTSNEPLDLGSLSAAQLDADNARLYARIDALEREIAQAQVVFDQKIKLNGEMRAKVAELERQLARLAMPMDAVASAAAGSQAGGGDTDE
ncbi:hypothetical protein RQP46_011099 [Phenoliferia psychrophenolica]